MASNVEGPILEGSDLFFDCSCFTCQENDINKEAEFYCEKCSKLFCGKCVELHNTLFKKHATLGKENISQWPETNVDTQELCQEHKKEKLTRFCEDHSQLICHACHINTHMKCTNVVLIADKVKDLHLKGYFKQLSATVDTQNQKLIQMKDDFDENMKSLEKSYETILKEINAFRRKINGSLDLLEKNTKKELNTFLATTRTSIKTDIENCMKFIKNITCFKDDWLRRKDKSEALSFIKYTKCLDQSLKVESVLQEMNEKTLTFNPDTTIQQTLSTFSGLGQILSQVKRSQPAKGKTQDTLLTRYSNKLIASSQSDPGNQTTPGLKVKESNPKSISSRQYSTGNQTSDPTKLGQGSDTVSISSPQLVQGYQPGAVSKPDQIMKVIGSKKYCVKIESDSDECNTCISGIYETVAGKFLITDWLNSKVKLLDQTYKVVAHNDLPGKPWSLCSIDSSLVAITLDNNEVHFIRVTNGHLVNTVLGVNNGPLNKDRILLNKDRILLNKDRILMLRHSCYGIAHHQGNLYITDGGALHHYTVDGGLGSKMYEGTSDNNTVSACAVSPDGERIYVTNQYSNQLVTLSRDGIVISTFTDPALDWNFLFVPPGLHVTDSGQVLVCGGYSPKILQVDRDGRQRLAEVVTQKDGVTHPISVYYSKHTDSLIVGRMGNNNITVFTHVLAEFTLAGSC